MKKKLLFLSQSRVIEPVKMAIRSRLMRERHAGDPKQNIGTLWAVEFTNQSNLFKNNRHPSLHIHSSNDCTQTPR